MLSIISSDRYLVSLESYMRMHISCSDDIPIVFAFKL